MHSPRELEERRLIEMVAGVIERRGKLLIPAFAIGRAQEVALMLLKQFRSKRLASFPVWITEWSRRSAASIRNSRRTRRRTRAD